MFPPYTHQPDKHRSFKIVDSLVVLEVFGHFHGVSFRKHWFMDGLRYYGSFLEVTSGLTPVFPEQQHFPHWYRWDSGEDFSSQKIHVWKMRIQGISSA